jgi:hypothetical protein
VSYDVHQPTRCHLREVLLSSCPGFPPGFDVRCPNGNVRCPDSERSELLFFLAAGENFFLHVLDVPFIVKNGAIVLQHCRHLFNLYPLNVCTFIPLLNICNTHSQQLTECSGAVRTTFVESKPATHKSLIARLYSRTLLYRLRQ